MTAKLKSTLGIRLGGAGGDAGGLSVMRIAAHLVRRYAPDRQAKESLTKALKNFHRELWLDSDDREPTVIPADFAGGLAEVIAPPPNYRQMDSHSGREILERLEEEPFAYLRDWVAARRELIEKKETGAEAEGIRLFGTLITLENIVAVQRQLRYELSWLRGFVRTAAYQDLLRFGLPVDGDGFNVEICGSTAGGQATGLWLIVLGLLALELENFSPKPKVKIRLLLPGFHVEGNDLLGQTQHLKTLAVLSDLARAKRGVGNLCLPHPAGRLEIPFNMIGEMFQSISVYQPEKGGDEAKYVKFISQTADSIVASQLAEFAANLRRVKSNAIANARTVRQLREIM